MSDDRDLIKGFWALLTDSQNRKEEAARLEQRTRELEAFQRSSDHQTQLYAQQLAVVERQTSIQERQTKILNQTKWVYIALLIIAIINLIAFIFK